MIIYKYPLASGSPETEILLPVGAKFLTVQTQMENICLWFKIPEGKALAEKRTFVRIGTGHGFDDQSLRYLGTCFQMGQQLVWHIFEEEGGVKYKGSELGGRHA